MYGSRILCLRLIDKFHPKQREFMERERRGLNNKDQLGDTSTGSLSWKLLVYFKGYFALQAVRDVSLLLSNPEALFADQSSLHSSGPRYLSLRHTSPRSPSSSSSSLSPTASFL